MQDISQIEIGAQQELNSDKSPVIKCNMLAIFEKMATSEKLKTQTEKIRAAKNKDQQTKLKSGLPVIIVSSTTTQRKKAEGDVHTGFMWADIDKFKGKDNPDKTLEEGIAIVEDLCRDYPYIIGYFISPSGNGIKVLCAIEPDVESHKMSFRAVGDLFAAHGLHIDPSGSDAKRVCYVCYDPNITKTLIEPLKVWDGERIKPAKPQPVKEYKIKREFKDELSDLDKVELCLPFIHPDDDYLRWVQVGMVIKDCGGSCGLWEDWSAGGQLYREGECQRKWGSFNGGNIGIGSVIEWAKQGNGGVNPVIKAKNERPPVKVDIEKDFDEVEDEEVPVPEYYYFKGKYYMIDSSGERYISIGDGDLTRQLRLLGFSAKGAEGEMSAIDKIKASIVKDKTVDAVGALAGRSIGLHEDKVTGMRHLVTRKNRRIIAKEGDWSGIRGILQGLYDDQVDYVYSWLKRSRYQLAQERYMQGHVLAIAGKVGGGKSLTAEVIIRPLLGASAKAWRYLAKDNDFNADLVGSELLLMDDEAGSRSMADRKKFGSNLKMVSAGSKSVSCHGKGVDAYNVSPLWRVVVCLNDDEEAIGAFPPLGEGDCDSIGDKVLLLKCYQTELPFVGDRDQFVKIEKMIERELPAFAWFLDNEWEIPAKIKTGNCRFGFDEFHHPDLLETLNRDSNERTLLSVTDWVFFDAEYPPVGVTISVDAVTGRRYWQGKAQQWSHALLASKEIPHRVKNTVEGELAFGDSAQKSGLRMKAVAGVSGGRIENRTINGTKYWRIWEAENYEKEPF